MEALDKVYQYVLEPLTKLIFAAGIFLFVLGLVEFLWNVNEGGAQNEGKQHMLWGIAGILIMVSTMGIIAIIENTFGIGSSSSASTDVGRAPVIVPNFFGQ